MYAATRKMSKRSARIPLSQPSQKIQPPVFRSGRTVGSIDVCASATLPATRTTTSAPASTPTTLRAVTIGRDSRNPEPARQPTEELRTRAGGGIRTPDLPLTRRLLYP